MVAPLPIALSRDQIVLIDGVAWRTVRRLEDSRYQFENVENGQLTTYSDEEIHDLYLAARFSAGTVQSRRTDAGRVTIPIIASKAADLEQGRCRFFYAKAFIANCETLSGSEAKAFLHSSKSDLDILDADGKKIIFSKPSHRILLTWCDIYLSLGEKASPETMKPENYRKGNRKPRILELITDIFEEVFDEFYTRRPAPSVADFVATVKGRIQVLIDLAGRKGSVPMVMPSESSIRRWVARQDLFSMLTCRRGKQVAKRLLSPIGQLPELSRPLEVIEIDHTPLDALIIDEVTQLTITNRLTVTAAIDVYSRGVWGLYIGFDPPSYVTIMRCLLNGIASKKALLKQHALNPDDWNCCGFPERIVVDNGKEFHSADLHRVADAFGMEIQYAPSRTPQAKPHIERWLGTFNRLVAHGLAGTTMSDSKARGDYNSAKEARHDF